MYEGESKLQIRQNYTEWLSLLFCSSDLLVNLLFSQKAIGTTRTHTLLIKKKLKRSSRSEINNVLNFHLNSIFREG